jgi:hypothetical protein
MRYQKYSAYSPWASQSLAKVADLPVYSPLAAAVPCRLAGMIRDRQQER